MIDFERIIIVDDNETSIFVNQDVIEGYFIDNKVISFSNSQLFLDECFNNNTWFTENTLVLLDINMPGKDGFDVLEEIEEELEDFDKFMVIMVTSSNLKRDMECSTRFDCVLGYIEKPLSPEKIEIVLNQARSIG